MSMDEKTARLALSYGYGPNGFMNNVRVRRKPLSPRRAREFRDRYLKKMFGTRKQRAERFARLSFMYGKAHAIRLSRMTLVPVSAKTVAAFDAVLGR